MTQDEMIELARQAGFAEPERIISTDTVRCVPDLAYFAKLVADKEREQLTDAAMKAAEKTVDVAIKLEREACAKECWKQMGLLPIQAWTVNPYEQCIDAILARGQA